MKCLIPLSLCFFCLACGSMSRTGTARSSSDPLVVQRPPPPPAVTVPDVSLDQIYQIGQKHYQQKDFNKAFAHFERVYNQSNDNNKKGEAGLWALRSLVRSGRSHDAAEYSTRLLSQFRWADSNLLEITQVQIRSLETIGALQQEVSAYRSALNNPQLANDRETFRIQAQQMILNRLGHKELSELGSDPGFGDLRAAAYYRLGEIAMEDKDFDEARSYFSRSSSISESNEFALRSKDLLEQLEALRRVAPRTVGAVLPLSGRNAAVGQKALRGLQMGLGLYPGQSSSFKLAVIDDEGNPDTARRGVERLVKEDNAIAIVGSVLSRNAVAVSAKANELNVPNIGLSQKSGLTEIGESVFRNAMTSEMQVRFLVKKAMEDYKLRRFAIVYPNDAYGVEFANLFWSEVLARGGQVTAVQVYSPKENDFRALVQKLTGTFYIEARLDEYRIRLREKKSSGKKKSVRTELEEDVLTPVVDFDAIFLPDSVRALGQVSAALSYGGVRDVTLLGTNLWNHPGVARRAGNFANRLLFVDSFVSSQEEFKRSQFVRDYKTLFSEEPGLIEVQAYDSGLLIRQLVSEGATSRSSLNAALTRLNNFPGALGPLSISQDREIQRPLSLLSLTGNEITPARTPLLQR